MDIVIVCVGLAVLVAYLVLLCRGRFKAQVAPPSMPPTRAYLDPEDDEEDWGA